MKIEKKKDKRGPRGVMDCGIVASEFELQSHYYGRFRTNNLGKVMNTLVYLIVSLLFFDRERFGIR